MMHNAAIELVIFVGLQASGKTTFFRERFADSHVHVSKDLFRNATNRERRQNRLIEEALRDRKSVVVDNTNPGPGERATAIALGRSFGAKVVGYCFESRLALSLERNCRREGVHRVPDIALRATARRLVRPSLDEGFEELWYVAIVNGSFVVQPWTEILESRRAPVTSGEPVGRGDEFVPDAPR